MSAKKITKEDVPFLVEAIESRHKMKSNFASESKSVRLMDDNVQGDMSIPNPVEVNVQGTMSKEDYEKCSFIMAVCTNMVQQTITNTALDAGINIQDALKNMNAWIQGFTSFPFPFFTFKDSQNDKFDKSDFSLKADPEIVDQVLNIKNVVGLKDAVVGALKKTDGEIASYSKQNRDFNYFGVITGYNETEISTRVIKFSMQMSKTDATALCVTYKNTELHSKYDTYQFVGDKYMMIKMQEAIQERLIEKMAERLLEFIDDFYRQQLDDYRSKIKDIVAGMH